MANEFGSVAAGTWQSGSNASAAIDVSHLKNVVVMLGSTVALSGGTAVALEVSWDGTTFALWEAAKTAVGIYTTIPQCKEFRMKTSSYSAGTPVVGYSGESAT
jgi:hypothetical protein